MKIYSFYILILVLQKLLRKRFVLCSQIIIIDYNVGTKEIVPEQKKIHFFDWLLLTLVRGGYRRYKSCDFTT